MTKQATLGPIDPSVNGPLNPQIPGAPAHARTPVSVEALNAYIEFCRESLGSEAGLKEVLMSLSDKVHPLVLGDAFRARSQIRMLAGKLLASQNTDTRHTEDLLRFLCSESGSHDYTINRREARDELGLPVEKPDGPLYNLIKAIYDDISSELALTAPYDPVGYLGARAQAKYVIPRALVESLDGGSHSFVSEGLLKRVQLPQGSGEMQVAIHDERKFEGWRFQAPTQERK